MRCARCGSNRSHRGFGASAIGVLLTRGHAIGTYCEAVRTFRTLAPLTISTENPAQAFQPVRQQDYAFRLQQRVSHPAPLSPCYYGYGPFLYSPFYRTTTAVGAKASTSIQDPV
ncbi:MAG: hypothetical protein IT166_11030 [Bryobacterales bacterium]|nr:hypothetical protein [Bryobacterales bacterium]